MSELPEAWTKTTVGELADSIQYGHTASSTSEEVGPRFLRITDIQENRVDWETVPFCKIPQSQIPKYRLAKGDLVFARTGATVGKSFLIQTEIPESIFASYLIRVRVTKAIEARYLYHFFQSSDYWHQISDSSSGIGQPNVNGKKLAAITLPIAPIAEQRRIVARIEELFSRLDAGVAALRHAKAQLQRYRQSVLAAAVTGQLTQPWREQHPDTEPAAALRRSLIETRQVMWTGKYHSPVPVARDQSRVIPESWAWMSADELIREPLKNGLSLKGFANPPGVAVLKLDALNENGLDYSKRQYLRTDSPKVAEIQIERGDFLISRGNGSLRLLAKGVLADVVPENVIFPDTMIRFRFPPALHRWISVAWRSRVLRGQIEGRAKSTAGIYKIAQGDLRPIAIPIPPLAEQHQIVAEVESRTTAIDHLEAELDRHITRSNRLRQSILAAAFSGKL